MENEKKEIGRKEQEVDAIMKAHKSIAALAEYMFGDEVFKDSPGTDGVDDIVTVLGRAVMGGRISTATLELPNGVQAKIFEKGGLVAMKRTLKVVDENVI